MKKLNQSQLQIVSSFKHSTAFEFNKIKEIPKSYKTKQQDIFYKYEKPKRNKYAKKGLFENCSKINQY